MKMIQKAKLNVLSTLIRQTVTTLCGILLPRVLIGAYGSEIYGATTSIAQFLSYITLLEGGIGAVARGALYEPLARGDKQQISRIHQAIHSFFMKIAGVFLIYTLLIAFLYHDIAKITVFQRHFTFLLVITISLTTMANYLGGFSNLTLMNADQKQYLTNTVMIITNIFNMLVILVLVWTASNIIVVKLASALILATRRIYYSCYVKQHYQLSKVPMNGYQLDQKWTGMAQHIAYFLHINTDIILLTLFADLKLVAVYSIYYLVVRSIWDISSSFSGGMEAKFGELLAKKQVTEVRSIHKKYEMMLTLMALILFGCTGVLIIPFVRLYMAGVTDANYIQPLFALIMLLAEAINCFVLPYTTLPISANQLRQSRWGSYGEAIINVGLSLILIQWNPLLGVAIGTLSATLFKALFYINYTAKNILCCSLCPILARITSATVVLLVISSVGMTMLWQVPMDNFLIWILWSAGVFLVVGAIITLFGMLIFHKEMKQILPRIFPICKE